MTRPADLRPPQTPPAREAAEEERGRGGGNCDGGRTGPGKEAERQRRAPRGRASSSAPSSADEPGSASTATSAAANGSPPRSAAAAPGSARRKAGGAPRPAGHSTRLLAPAEAGVHRQMADARTGAVRPPSNINAESRQTPGIAGSSGAAFFVQRASKTSQKSAPRGGAGRAAQSTGVDVSPTATATSPGRSPTAHAGRESGSGRTPPSGAKAGPPNKDEDNYDDQRQLSQ